MNKRASSNCSSCSSQRSYLEQSKSPGTTAPSIERSLSINHIIDTYTQYKTKSVPPEGVRFPANLGLVLTKLTTWDGIGIGPLSKILAVKYFEGSNAGKK
jgi:hypothetical protein